MSTSEPIRRTRQAQAAVGRAEEQLARARAALHAALADALRAAGPVGEDPVVNGADQRRYVSAGQESDIQDRKSKKPVNSAERSICRNFPRVCDGGQLPQPAMMVRMGSQTVKKGAKQCPADPRYTM